jgi:hypothetical protein
VLPKSSGFFGYSLSTVVPPGIGFVKISHWFWLLIL